MTRTSVLSRPGTTAVVDARPRPSKGGYWLGAAVVIVGFIVAAVWGTFAVMRVYERVDAFPRTDVPGSVAMDLEQGAGQVIYYEQPVDTAMPVLADLNVVVTGPTGEGIPVGRYGGDLRYDLPGGDGTIGHALATFEPPASGTYEVETTGTSRIPGAIA